MLETPVRPPRRKRSVRKRLLLRLAAVLALYILGGVLATEWLWGQLFGRTERAAFQTTPVYEAFAAELPREAVSIPSGDNALAGPLGKGAGAACF